MPADKSAADYLSQEYLFLQQTVEDFDARALTIKAWSVTFSAAGLGLAYQQHNPVLLLVAAGSALVFWIVEAVWKYHQRAFYPRLLTIEKWFKAQSEEPKAAPFQLTSQWDTGFVVTHFRKGKGWGDWHLLVVPIFPGVMLPHAVVLIGGIALFFLWPPQAEKSKAPEPSVIYIAK